MVIFRFNWVEFQLNQHYHYYCEWTVVCWRTRLWTPNLHSPRQMNEWITTVLKQWMNIVVCICRSRAEVDDRATRCGGGSRSLSGAGLRSAGLGRGSHAQGEMAHCRQPRPHLYRRPTQVSRLAPLLYEWSQHASCCKLCLVNC